MPSNTDGHQVAFLKMREDFMGMFKCTKPYLVPACVFKPWSTFKNLVPWHRWLKCLSVFSVLPTLPLRSPLHAASEVSWRDKMDPNRIFKAGWTLSVGRVMCKEENGERQSPNQNS